MVTAVVPAHGTLLVYTSRTDALVESFLAGRSPRTVAAYRQDLADFALFVGTATSEDAANTLLDGGHGHANGLALAYRNSLVDRGLAAATVNRRLAALRSLVALARTVGMIPWTLDVAGMRAQAYRETAGPGTKGVDALFDALEARDDAKGARDRAIVACLFDLALRRGEVVSLDRAHLDLEGGTLAILGKGRAQRQSLTLPTETCAALAAWIAVRGDDPGPLFVNFAPVIRGDGRITGDGVYKVIRRLGAKANLPKPLRPHALRHAGVTAALDAAGGDVRKVQRFSRHKDLRTLLIYDDNRADLAGEVARLVAKSRRAR